MKLYALSLIALLSAGIAQAQQISQDEAYSRAQAYLRTRQPKLTAGTANSRVGAHLSLSHVATRPADGKALYYVFNQGVDQGFVIVGGDESAHRILGYSDHGTFLYDQLPDNFRWWMNLYEEQIGRAIDQKALRPALTATATQPGQTATKATERTDITPLIKSKWSQNDPYNRALMADFISQTGITDYDLAVGCIGTAMAQTMYYYRWPATGTGSVMRNPHEYEMGDSVYTFIPRANFAETTYDWENMLDRYNKGKFNDTQADAVATLSYHAGVAVDMSYDKSSSAYAVNIPNAFTSYFGYDNSIRFESRTYFSDQAWEDMVYAELAAGRPIIYGGQSQEGGGGGHEFLCDGYRASDGLFSINWGWGDYCDGYFALTGAYALQPGGSSTGGAGESAAYKYLQEIITHIQPEAGGKETPIVNQAAEDAGAYLVADGVRYSTEPYIYNVSEGNKTIALHSSIWNNSRSLTDFTIGIRAYDSSSGLTYYWDCKDVNLPSLHLLDDCSFFFNIGTIAFNGTYEIQPVVRRTDTESDDDWFPIGTLQSHALPYLVIHGAQEVAARDVQFTIPQTEVEVARQITISHTPGYTATITYTSQDPTICTVTSAGVITGMGVGTTTIHCHADEMLINANRIFNATDYDLPITVVPTVKQDPIVTIADTALVVGGKGSITVENYDGHVEYLSSNTKVVTVTNGNLAGVSEGEADITVYGASTALYNGFNVVFHVTVSPFSASFYDVPYFNDGNNTWSEDIKIHLPLQNNGNQFTYMYCYARLTIDMGGGGTSMINYTWGQQIQPGKQFLSEFDLAASLNRLGISIPYDVTQTLYFFKDQLRTIPFETPSIEFQHRQTLDYSLNIPASGYGTLILPFATSIPKTDASGQAVECHAYLCTGVSFEGVLVFEEASTIERNVPYLITTNGEATFKFHGPKAVDADKPTFTKGFFTGVVGDCNYEVNDYVMQESEGKTIFHRLAEGDTRLSISANKYSAFIRLFEPEHETLWLNEADGLSAITSDAGQTGIFGTDGTPRRQLEPGINLLVQPDGSVRKILLNRGQKLQVFDMSF